MTDTEATVVNEETELCSQTSRVKLPKPEVASAKFLKAIFVGCGLTWLIIAGCFAIAIYIIIGDTDTHVFKLTSLSETAAEISAFAVNVAITLVAEFLGYIHSTSLRWALYREGRLEFNTNIRLFTSARNSAPNRWHCNAIWCICLILCYTASSLLFIPTYLAHGSDERDIYVNGMGVAILGIGLMGQATIVSICAWVATKDIRSWSSNPLNNTLALRRDNLMHNPGRCMMAASQKREFSHAQTPQNRQTSLFSLLRSVRVITLLVWIFALLAVAWFTVILFLAKMGLETWKFDSSWKPIDASNNVEHTNNIILYLPSQHGGAYRFTCPLAVQVLLGTLFVCAIQASQTMGLHSVELLVNMARDEDVWRAAYVANSAPFNKKGASRKGDPFLSAVTSWQNVVLFLAKALLHWIIGQSLVPSTSKSAVIFKEELGPTFQFTIVYIRVLAVAIVAILIAAFATYLALQRPSGCQPAAWGHLQTLADLIDNWDTDKDGNMYWGDKGKGGDGIRHAGTSGALKTVGRIKMEKVYA